MNLKVVVIDDDAYDRKVICDSLIMDDYEVIEAEDGKSGLELILKESPDLVICDVKMPMMGGDEVLEKLRNSGDDMGIIPFIFISGYGDGQERINRLKQGANNCFEKPVDLPLLSAYVKSNLQGMERVSNYLTSRLDSIAKTISETLGENFNTYVSVSSGLDSYVDTIIAGLHDQKAKGTFPHESPDGVSRLDYIKFFLEEHEKRKLLANTTNGEDLSWLLIFLVAKSQVSGEKLPMSDLYLSAPSAKSTINARIKSLIEDDIFQKSHDINDGRRQLISLSENFYADLMSHIDSSLDLIKEKII